MSFLGDLNDIDEAISVRKETVERLEESGDDIPIYLNELSTVLQIRFERTEVLSDLTAAVEASERAIQLARQHEDRAKFSDNLSLALQARYRLTGNTVDLEKAIDLSQEAVSIGGSYQSNFLHNLSNALQARFERFGLINDINSAVVAQEKAIDLTCRDNATYLHNLAIALDRRFCKCGSLEDIDRAINLMEEISRHVQNTKYQIDLANCIMGRYERTLSLHDLSNVVVAAQKALDLGSSDPFSLAEALHVFCYVLTGRFQATGLVDDINRAVDAGRQAIKLTENNPMYMMSLGNALERRFTWGRQTADLNDAVAFQQKVVEITLADHPSFAGYLTNLGNVLVSRFRETGSIGDLNSAIEQYQNAVQAAQEQDLNRATYLNNLGDGLRTRFDQIGSIDDLNGAILATQGALDAVARDHPRRPIYLNNLGNSLRELFNLTHSIDDINKAVLFNKQSVDLTSAHAVIRGDRLNNLGSSLKSRFYITGNETDLDDAIHAIEEALACTPREYPRKPSHLNNLATCYIDRFHISKLKNNLEKAIDYFQEALELTSDERCDRAALLINLARSLQDRYNITDSEEDVQMIIAKYEEAVGSVSAPSRVRIIAARGAAEFLKRHYPNPKLTSRFLTLAVELLPETSTRALTWRDQQVMIAQFAGLVSSAVAASLESENDPIEALRLLDLGRGVMGSLQLDTRSDVTDLESSYPELAQEFKQLRDELDPPILNVDYHESGLWNQVANLVADRISKRHTSAQRMALIQQKIRSLPSFERFLRGPSKTELLNLASSGPIVVFNVSEIRSDALLIAHGDIRCFPLPDFRQADIAQRSLLFLQMLDGLSLSTYNTANKTLVKLLEWLWDVAVGPILDALGLRDAHTDGEWPRIWWATSGWLSLLPIHSAGYHQHGSTSNALDRVVSSYIPSLKALSYSRQKAENQLLQNSEILIVSMPKTPGQKDLPHVAEEVIALDHIIPGSFSKLILETPSKDDVQQKIRTSQAVHFACHGTTNLSNPSKSQLLMRDWRQDAFTVTDIIALKLENPQMVYLSACCAASNRVESLLDEGIHIAGACQLAGFPHVVGTLWSVDDRSSAKVAKDVYSGMLNGRGVIDVSEASTCLHAAVRRLRDGANDDSGLRSPRNDALSWAPYIYLGA